MNHQPQNPSAVPQKSSRFNFIGLMVVLTALTALSIDMILPALPLIQSDLKVLGQNHVQFVITALFIGFTMGQLVFGPLSDAIGRKKTVYYGLAFFMVGTIICIIAQSLEILLLGRFVQGLGAACLRVMAMAITRDLYSGQKMAEIMSIVMAIFILVPVIAPALGQGIILFADWRFIFVFFLAIALLSSFWIYKGLDETLHPEYRRPFCRETFFGGAKRMLKHPLSGPHVLCSGLTFGIMVGYISTAQQLFQDYYAVGDMFSLYFGGAALSIGIGSLSNSYLVRKYSMRKVLHYALLTMTVLSVVTVGLLFINPAFIGLSVFVGYLVILFYCMGLCFGNMNAIALSPMGDIAGVASAVLGAGSSAISVMIGSLIGQAYHHNITPFLLAVAVLSFSSFGVQYFSHKAYEKTKPSTDV